ncbi:MAG: DNA internalization-related competence protein ComEC/Rec2 [Gemmatimonadota bacterium]|nr:DNA internalization-related competence protein ComEC/Rec2 [Gemmatimonadota bacterium]
MPLIAFAVAAYAVGLLLGFGGGFIPAMIIAVVTAVAALIRRFPTIAALGALVAAGAGVAFLHDRASEACRTAALARHAWDVTLDERAATGSFVRGAASIDGCIVDVALAVARGGASAGEVARVTGAALPGRRNILIKHAFLIAPQPSDRLRAMRGAAAARIDSAFGSDAPLARALLIADERDIDSAMRDRFANAGIIHMLSISGLHVGIIAMALQLLFRAVRLPAKSALIAAVIVTAFYIAVIGAPPPALRSGVMLAAVALSRLLERPTSPWAALAIGAAVPLAAPAVVLDVGYQLSVLGMAGLVASGALAKRWVAPRWSGWRRPVASALLTSVVASFVSGPLVAWTFGRISLIAPAANLVASPIVALAQPALFLALILSPIPSAARFVAAATHPLLLAFDRVAAVATSVPYAAVTCAPTLTAASLAGVATVALIAACISRFPARPLICCGAALALAAWSPLIASGSGSVELHAIDVGQGDALALRTPHGHWILIDAGRMWRGGDAGRSAVVPYLRRLGGPVDLFVLSHPHADHVGGAASTVRALRPRLFWDSGFLLAEPAYQASLDGAAESGTRWHRVRPGDSTTIDSVHVTALAPDSAWQARQENPNESSVIVMARYGGVRFLLMGDAELGEEAWLVAHDSLALRADVLKVGHHGSKTSSSAALVRAVHPSVALVSVGVGNTYGHPNAATMRALADAGAALFRTDLLGTIVVRTNGESISVGVRGEWWKVGAPR